MNSLAKKVVLILAAIHLVVAAFVLFNRLTSATIIDCSEPIHAQLAYQAGEGFPLYGKVSERIILLPYTPIAYQAVGIVSRFFGYDIRAMRFVVAVFGLTAIFFMSLTIYQLTRNKYLALVGACLYFGIDVGPWYVGFDPNGAHACFAWIAIYLLVRDRSLRWGTVIAVTVALFASFWSKHTGLAYLAAGLFYFWLSNRHKALAATILAAFLVTGSVMYYANQPDSCFMKVIFAAKDNSIMWSYLLTPTLYPELLGRFGVLLCAVLAGLAGNGLKIKKWLAPEYIFLGASAFVGILTRLKYGSGPAQAILFYGMIICLGLSFLHRFYQEKLISGALVLAMIAVQSLALIHDISPSIITKADTARYRQIINILRTPGKNVYYHPSSFLNFYAGKPLNGWAIVEWSCWNKGKFDNSGPPEVREYLRKDPYDIVIIDIPLEDTARPLYERLNESYQAVQEIPADPRGPTASIRYKKVIFMRKVDLKAQN